jgi:hypothetical protein
MRRVRPLKTVTVRAIEAAFAASFARIEQFRSFQRLEERARSLIRAALRIHCPARLPTAEGDCAGCGAGRRERCRLDTPVQLTR